METALKQRVVGAIVLVALAVIFLPMLIKGPAPESGISDVPLDLPQAPGDALETRELPLVTPGNAPAAGVIGMDASASAGAGEPAQPDGAGEAMLPATTAAGDYAVSFGRYATAADAQRVVAALRNSQLPGYQESVDENGRTLHRVRIGPYATQAEAEAARLRATHVNDAVNAQVVTLDAGAATEAPQTAPTPTTASTPLASPAPAERSPAPKPREPEPAAPKPPTATASTRPAAAPAPARGATAAATATRRTDSAAADTGFAVQLGAFGNAAEATRLRDRARDAGLPAFVESVRTDKGVLSRVRVGPVLTRAEADQLKAQIAAKLGIADAIVKPHP